MSTLFEGRTDELEAPPLDGPFWTEGQNVTGVVVAARKTENGLMYRLELSEPVQVGEELEDVVEIGNLTGFRMAIEAAQRKNRAFDGLRKNDLLEIECVGIKLPKKEGYSPRPNFRIKVVRPDSQARAAQ